MQETATLKRLRRKCKEVVEHEEGHDSVGLGSTVVKVMQRTCLKVADQANGVAIDPCFLPSKCKDSIHEAKFPRQLTTVHTVFGVGGTWIFSTATKRGGGREGS